jgi:hypothetical protein
VLVVGRDDLGEAAVAGERASRGALAEVSERRPSARARSPKLLVSAVELDLAMEKNMLRRNGSRSQEREGSAAAGVGIIGFLKRG